MSNRRTLLAASILASFCLTIVAQAQEAPAASSSAQTTTNPDQPDATQARQLGTVTVTGIRASLQKSLDTKRNADAIVDAIDATDIGKFPATNVAEALAQIPGVTVDHLLGATQRISIDGTDPSLNLAYLDGHPVAQALWLYGDSPNRGFNYSLLPPEILGKLEVFKSPEARLPEGSLGGSVFMHTVQPLDVPSNTASGAFGMNYNDMVKNSRPNGSLFYSWHNADKTFGVDVSAQHYEQFTSRQGQEIFGYTPVSAAAAVNPGIAAQVAAGAIKSTDQFPSELNAANFQQTEKRNSVFVNIQYKPSEKFDSTLSLMYLNDSLNNINSSLYPIPAFGLTGISQLGPAKNGIIQSGTQVGTPCQNTTSCTSTASSYQDADARHAFIATRGADWRGKYYGDGWQLGGQIGVSTSRDNISQAFKEIFYGGGFDWNIAKGFNYTDQATANDPSYWADNNYGGNIGYKPYKAKDAYAQIDFSKDLDGFFNQLQVGARYYSHYESQALLVLTGVPFQTLNQIGYGGLTDLSGAAGIGLQGSTVRHVQTAGYNAIYNAVLNGTSLEAVNPSLTYDNTFNVQQKNSSAYLQVDFGNDAVRGNIGARYVHAVIDAYGYNVPGTCTTYDCTFAPGFGYVGQSTTHNNWLPALNIAWNITPDFILRGAASETVAYAPYNELAPFFEANDTLLTAAAGNPNANPYKSVNFNLSAEWYFNPGSVVALSGFYKNVLNYVVNATTTQTRQNGSWPQLQGGPIGDMLVANGQCTAAGLCQYGVSAPINGGRAKVKGAAISYQQAFAESGFGIRANYTYSDSKTQAGGPLPYNSKNSFTVAPYFEKNGYSASIAYNWRNQYLAGGYVAGAPSTYTGSYKELDSTLGYAFNKNFSLSLNMLNLLDSTYRQYYGASDAQLANEYAQGREFELEAHFKF